MQFLEAYVYSKLAMTSYKDCPVLIQLVCSPVTHVMIEHVIMIVKIWAFPYCTFRVTFYLFSN